jgi:hypothetical protein
LSLVQIAAAVALISFASFASALGSIENSGTISNATTCQTGRPAWRRAMTVMVHTHFKRDATMAVRRQRSRFLRAKSQTLAGG